MCSFGLDLLYRLTGQMVKPQKAAEPSILAVGAAYRIMAQADQWERVVIAADAAKNADHTVQQIPLGVLLAFAYPDRIAQRRNDGRYLLANGRGAVLPELQPLSRSPYLAACELDDAGTESRIRIAAELSAE